jgi:hypothetical protein
MRRRRLYQRPAAAIKSEKRTQLPNNGQKADVNQRKVLRRNLQMVQSQELNLTAKKLM